MTEEAAEVADLPAARSGGRNGRKKMTQAGAVPMKVASRIPLRSIRATLLAVIARSEATKQSSFPLAGRGLLRGACHRARVRATRWLAMTEEAAEVADLPAARSGGRNGRKKMTRAVTKAAREDKC
jgi:hypothetical protein